MATAPKLSAFGQAVEQAFTARDILVGQPAKRRKAIADIESSGMSADEFRLVMRWWDRQTGCKTPGLLFDVLGDEENWRDVVDAERPRIEREESRRAERTHTPGTISDWEPNPLIRVMGKARPFTDEDAVEAWRMGFGPIKHLAAHLGWTDDQAETDARREDRKSPGVERLESVLRAAGLDSYPESSEAAKSHETAAQRRQREKREKAASDRHEKALAWSRIRVGKARKGDHEKVAGFDPAKEVSA